MKTFSLVIGTLVALSHLTPPSAFAEPTADAIVAKYDDIMGPRSFETEMSMVIHREDGSTRQYALKTLKSGDDKFRVWFLSPASIAGQEMLRVGDNAWVYLPSLKRASRIANRDSFQGGDFSNADVMKVNYRADYDALIIEKDLKTIKLELRSKSDGTAYAKILLAVDAQSFQPQEAQYFGTSGKMLRSATFEEVKEFQNGYHRPSRITMKNEVSPGRKSVVEFRSVRVGIEPPANRFTLGDLGR